MKSDSEIIIHHEMDYISVKLNRPLKKNALDGFTLQKLIEFFEEAIPPHIRFVILSGTGKDFCSGADLNWMKNYDETEALKSSSQLIRLYTSMRNYNLPIIARVFGKVIAGGVGLIAASDIVFASEDSQFRIPEVRVGLVPAIMAPFIVDRIGLSRFRELSLTGRMFNSQSAMQYGLIDFIESPGDREEIFSEMIEEIKKGGPNAITATKQICRKISTHSLEILLNDLSSLLTKARKNPESSEGINAFFEKRSPSWRKDSSHDFKKY